MRQVARQRMGMGREVEKINKGRKCLYGFKREANEGESKIEREVTSRGEGWWCYAKNGKGI